MPLHRLKHAAAGHLSRSLWDVMESFFGWLSRLPPWAQPPFFGALLIYAFEVWRGGLIVIPLLAAIGFFLDPNWTLRMLFTLVVLAPAGGFLGGVLYSLIHPLTRRFKIVGVFIEHSLAAWGYLAVLWFVILPLIDPKNAGHLSDSGDWMAIGGLGILVGIVMGLQTRGGDTGAA